MSLITSKNTSTQAINNPPIHWPTLLALACAVTLLHLLTNGRYGFHRDELQFLSDARHLDWGYVCYPPLTPFIQHIGLALFGVSMFGLRLFSVLAQATALIAVGIMARDLGGGSRAQFTAALAVTLSPLPLFNGTEFQYTSFDFLWWVLIACFVIRLLRTDNPRWWIAIGAVIGLGLLTKYAIVFYISGILIGLILTPARRYFLSPWFWAGVTLALLMFLPNFLWLVHHDFISYHFLQSIHARDVRIGRANGFLKDQFLVGANLFAAPLWLLGLAGFLLNRRYRMLAFMYLVPLALFFFGKGRGYYMAAAYPMLIAMGAVMGERWRPTLPRWARLTTTTVFFSGLALIGAYIIAVIIPLANSGPLRDFALKNNGDLREEFGWDDLVHTVVQIRDALPSDQQAHLGIVTGNYGEYGAIEILGAPYGLPQPIGTTNSEYLRGYPTPPPTTIIVIGNRLEDANALFTNCRLAAHNGNSEDLKNEESQFHPDIFLCGPPKISWEEIWKNHQNFG